MKNTISILKDTSTELNRLQNLKDSFFTLKIMYDIVSIQLEQVQDLNLKLYQMIVCYLHQLAKQPSPSVPMYLGLSLWEPIFYVHLIIWFQQVICELFANPHISNADISPSSGCKLLFYKVLTRTGSYLLERYILSNGVYISNFSMSLKLVKNISI